MPSSVWLPLLGIPLLILAINVVVRICKTLPQSAVPDLILCFVIFDLVAAAEYAHLQKYVRVDWMRESFVGIYACLAVVNIIGWSIIALDLEQKLIKCHADNGGYLNMNGAGLLLASLVLATFAASASILPFVWAVG
jgi:hypothetical protein